MVLSVAAFAQQTDPVDSPVQVVYAANLNVGDSVINLTNSGANATNLNANVYTFSPDEQLISCCCCVVTPNALVSLSAKADLISNTLTPAVPNSIVVKVVATTGTCNASANPDQGLPNGLLVWRTTLHATPVAGSFAVTETPASPATAGDITRIRALCGFIQSNGSGFGICRSCRLGGQGAAKQ